MASPRKRKLKKILKLRRKQQTNLVEQEAELPLMVDEPVVKEEESNEEISEVLEVKKPVAKKSAPKKSAPKKAAKKDD
jgi:predicted phosphohydrolase|tara:strand:+ start:863 stop:1096 length:234 start_codon:yes stop_codon:yes gene_type:complete